MCLQYKFFKNTMGKGEIAHNKQFLLFPQCFLPIWKTFHHFHQIWNCRLQTLSIWKSLKFVVWERVKLFVATESSVVEWQSIQLFPKIFVWICEHVSTNNKMNWKLTGVSISFVYWRTTIPFPNKPWFLRVCSTSLLKTQWEKEKLLVTSNFSFSHSVFYIFIEFKVVVCKAFKFERV